MKKAVSLLAVLLILGLPLTTYARTVQVIMGSNINVVNSNSANRFSTLFSTTNLAYATAAAPTTREIISAAGVLQNFSVRSTYPLGAGSYTATVIKSGSATTVTCTITDPARTCSDTTNTVRVAPGDSVEVRFLGAGGPNLITFSTAIDFVPDVSNETLVASTINDNQATFAYGSFFNRDTFAATEASTTQSLFGPGGVASGLRISVTTAPGAGTSMLFSLRANQATTSLACSTSDTGRTCSDTTNFASISPGSWVDFSNAPTGAAAANSALGFGMKFVPTKIGEFFFMGGSGIANQGTATTYLQFSGTSPTNGTTTQSDAQMIANAMTITSFVVGQTNTTSSTGGTRTYTLEVNGVPTSATCTTSGTSATTGRMCNWYGSVTVNQGDLLNYIDTVTGTVTNARVRITTTAIRPLNDFQHKFMGGILKIRGGFFKIK